MTYNRKNPFITQIVDRYALTKPGSKKRTDHIVLDLMDSGLTYQVGDSIAVQPVNAPELVAKTIEAMQASGNEIVNDCLLSEYLTKQTNLSSLSRKLISETAARHANPEKKELLTDLLKEENKGLLKKYLGEREIWDFLGEHQEALFSPEELCGILQPLLPRFYSIASSQRVHPNEVHLTVGYLEYETNGNRRIGVCTHYLCHLAPLFERSVPIYVQPSRGFTVPEQLDAPIIMIGPGTGVAPYRAFMEERVAQGATGKNWLFFGEWNRAYDFFYEDYWCALQEQGKLVLDVAFSRDQAHKVYVQHLMLENGAEFYRWLREGAYVYVCGNADRMAKDVDQALHSICEIHGQTDAKSFVKQLQKDKRYLKDIY